MFIVRHLGLNDRDVLFAIFDKLFPTRGLPAIVNLQ
jgi:hypothetical protein